MINKSHYHRKVYENSEYWHNLFRQYITLCVWLKFVIFITILPLLCTFSLHAQMDTHGTDFWLTFGRNYVRTINDVDLQIRIAGSNQPATGTITFTNLTGADRVVDFSVHAYQTHTYNLTHAQKAAVYNITTGVNNHSVHIVSDHGISVFALNQTISSADATNILPVQVLDKEYYHISYQPSAYLFDAYAIIATQNLTQVYHNGTPVATLNTGDVYYRTSANDMTGTHITADKPVACIAMNQGVEIPSGTPATDHLFQQLVPICSWGKNFFVPVSSRERDIVRIVASQNGTIVTQTGGTVLSGNLTLNAGQFVDIRVELTRNGCYIQTNEPVGVCAYLTGCAYHPNFLNDPASDPAQVWLPPIEQATDSALIAPFIPDGNTALDTHYALIVTPTVTKDNTKVSIAGGMAEFLSGGIWYGNPATEMSFYVMPLIDETAAYLYTNSAGIILMAYGTGTAESYYYLASMRNLNLLFYANDILNQYLEYEIICTDLVEFRAEISGNLSDAPGFLKWYIDDEEEIAARDCYTWSKILPAATYQIKLVALMSNNITTKTAEGILHIAPVEHTNFTENICQNDSVWFANQYYRMPGVYTDVLTTMFGCDSIVTMNLTVNHAYYQTETETICEAELPFAWRDTVFDAGTVGATFAFHRKTVFGCDSIVMLNLTVNSAYAQCELLEICDNQLPFTWRDTVFSLDAITDTFTFHRKTVFGCDSIVTLFLTVSTTPEVEIIAITDDFCNEDILILQAVSNGTSYLWSTGDREKQITITTPGIYTVTASIHPCKETADYTVAKCPCLLFIPNAFTPNGDATNDIFRPIFSHPEQLIYYHFYIFNRWGQMLFYTTRVEEGWDGSKCQEGVYIYLIEYRLLEEKNKRITGSVTLLKN